MWHNYFLCGFKGIQVNQYKAATSRWDYDVYYIKIYFIYYIIFFSLERDLFGAEPFDPFNCGAGDFPPDIQSKLDEMQVIILTDWPMIFFSFFFGS